MCGLTGLLDSSGLSEDMLFATVQVMTDSLHHRDPDNGEV